MRETLAAREVLRYVYLRTGKLLPIKKGIYSAHVTSIIVARKGQPLVRKAVRSKSLRREIAQLKPQQYLLRTVSNRNGVKTALIIGGDDTGTLYGAYRFAERLGVRFYPDGDTIPDGQIKFSLPNMSEIGKPLFAIRGALPFHDFPEGPDWWNQDDYLAYVTQLAKLRMNFIGLHTYNDVEPTVWIGLPSDAHSSGAVKFSYPASWYSTLRDSWGYAPAATSEYDSGAAQLFPDDSYGGDVMRGAMPFPVSSAQCNLVFDRAGTLLRNVFADAHSLGIKTCVGVEIPIAAPRVLQEHLTKLGKDANSVAVRKQLYDGMFKRAEAAYPLDYFWLWTPESWTWAGNTQDQLKAATDDLRTAVSSIAALGKPFQLATCGWVLGPDNDRSALDRFLPKGIPMSSLNRNVGDSPVDAAYREITDRPTWAIPWLENDPHLTAPQPWVGRMRYDATDARRLGCTGLIGIHWRTAAIAPNFAALADAEWDQAYVPSDFRKVKDGAMGGLTASFHDSVAGTDIQKIYQSVRYDMDGYRLSVPNGDYSVTLQFNEPFYNEAGKRVFDVSVQGKPVLQRLDIFGRAGKNRALDFTYPDVSIHNGALNIAFTPDTEYPAIAGIAISGRKDGGAAFVRKINCGGPSVRDYQADPYVNAAKWPTPDRSMPTRMFYDDYAQANFGESVAKAAGKIMAEVDGVHMPNAVSWTSGPGGIVPDRTPWAKVAPRYAFVAKMAALGPKVKGAGYRQRFDHWLDSYRADELMQKAACERGQLDIAVEKIRAAVDRVQKKKIAGGALKLRIALARDWERIIWETEATIRTSGGLGTIANLEQHTRLKDHFINRYDTDLAEALGGPLPASTSLSKYYEGPARIIVPTVRTQAARGESLTLKVILLGITSPGKIYWRRLGRGAFSAIPLHHVARGVYRVVLPPVPADSAAIEYYIRAGECVFPATAPAINQTVVVR